MDMNANERVTLVLARMAALDQRVMARVVFQGRDGTASRSGDAAARYGRRKGRRTNRTKGTDEARRRAMEEAHA
jgi:hypothetical protein